MFKNLKAFIKVTFFIAVTLGSFQSYGKNKCQVIYDAGSSGTRLYLYEKKNNIWTEHEGPKGTALADPVREIRGLKWSDKKNVVREVTNLLDDITKDGPRYAGGDLEWKAFDWRKHCDVTTASVFATAGMRIAEYVDRKRSGELWADLRKALQKKLGGKVKILTRTLPGFEEGLFAWLSVREKRGNEKFGIVEMGGASSQITFPCSNCKGSKKIALRGKNLKVFSYSFLGLGGDEASKIFGLAPSCAYGAGNGQSSWSEKKCSQTMKIKKGKGINDPYNFGNGRRGTVKSIPIKKARGLDWVLTGAFKFLSEKTIDKCCKSKGKCFQAKTSCFRAVYYKKYINDLGINYGSQRAGSSWTLGAVICNENNCLKDFGPKSCLWSKKGCL